MGTWKVASELPPLRKGGHKDPDGIIETFPQCSNHRSAMGKALKDQLGDAGGLRGGNSPGFSGLE